MKDGMQCRRPGFEPWVGKIPWRRAWQPIPILWPRESHGQRHLADCSPEDHTELDKTEATKQQHRKVELDKLSLAIHALSEVAYLKGDEN